MVVADIVEFAIQFELLESGGLETAGDIPNLFDERLILTVALAGGIECNRVAADQFELKPGDVTGLPAGPAIFLGEESRAEKIIPLVVVDQLFAVKRNE